MINPPPGFPPEDDDTEDGGGPPRREACDFCGKPEHRGACAEMERYCAEQAATLQDRARDARIIFKVLDRLAHPHPCPSCGDLTAASLCPACEEWGHRILDPDYATYGWA